MRGLSMPKKVLTLFADNDFQLEQVKEVLTGKLSKRGVDIRCLDEGNIEKSKRQQGQASDYGAHRH